MSRPTANLPTWTLPMILIGLVVVSGVIVAAGWTMTRPNDAARHVDRADRTERWNDNGRARLLPSREPAETPRLAGNTRGDDRGPEDPPVRKRVPDDTSDGWSGAIVLRRSISPVAPADPALEAPTPTNAKDPPLKSPLRWNVEKPAGGIGLIMPIEVAKIDDGSIPFTVRRLQFPDGKPEKLRLAVTPVMHDDLGSILTTMGPGYAFTQLRKADVFSFDVMKKHDVVFLTCADMYVQDFQAASALRKFVANGGTLYASDLRGDLLLAAFPEFRMKIALLPGVPQKVDASVVDDGLRSFLNRKTIPLSFDAPDWRPASFDPAKVTVCLKSEYRDNQGRAVQAPLLVKFRHQKGTVIFTSFHHTKNDSEIVRKLLDFLVFATVNARSEARLRDLMHRYHFSLHEMRPAAVNPDMKIEGTYQHQGGGLQIALGFENLGARLKLTLRSPSSKTIEHVDQGLYIIEIPKAEPGLWRYEVTPLELPHRNFPILIAVGSVRS